MTFYLKSSPASKRVRMSPEWSRIILWSAILETAATFAAKVRITSIEDGIHSPRSLHRFGLAVDFVLQPHPDPTAVVDSLRAMLGPDFDVLYETPPGGGNHFHIEYDPKYLVPPG